MTVPPMKLASLALFVCLASAYAQNAPPIPNLPDETVIATFEDGATMTLGEFKRIYSVLPQENQQQVLQNRGQFLQQWALMRKLARAAQANQLDQLSPAKEALEYQRLLILSQARMTQAANEISVLPSEVAKFYDANQNRYKQVRVRTIYIGFDGQKLTESGAKLKASQIVSQARAGADFVKLVRAQSDDVTSRAKDGDFGTLRITDNLPDPVRDAIFNLKEGAVSDPIRQPNGFYVFRAEKVDVRELADVRDDIYYELRQRRYGEWLEKTSREATVVFNSPSFLGAFPVDTTPRIK
jgi:parvulin-like peptidyl-prolyl isomerase